MKRVYALLICVLLLFSIFCTPVCADDTDFLILNNILVKYTGNSETVIIPEGVTAIGDDAFSDCTFITDIFIPNSITTISSNPFADCSALKRIRVSLDHPTLAVIHNVLFSKADKKLIAYPASLEDNTYSVPDGILYIGDYAFAKCDNLSSIIIPNSVTAIGQYSFVGCSHLKEITIPNSITFIDCYAFSLCADLSQISIPDSITAISSGTFMGCSNLTNVFIPESVTSIGSNAFSDCKNITRIDIPNSVISIGNGAFSGCNYLSIITFPNGITSIEDDTFSHCLKLKSFTIPHSVTSIGNNAFSFCSSLTDINIPNSVTSIGSNAFSFCTKLKDIHIPDSVISIGTSAFYDCNNLTLTVNRESFAAEYADKNGLPYIYPDSLDWLYNDTDNTALSPTTTPDITINPDSPTEDIIRLQNILFELGWLSDTPIGYFDSNTETAIKEFQYRCGLAETGIADEYTLQRLYASDAPRYKEYKDLKYGDKDAQLGGRAIMDIQIRMIELGYLENIEDNCDGEYGPNLQNAIMQLQIACSDLTSDGIADGIADEKFQRFLFSDNVLNYMKIR